MSALSISQKKVRGLGAYQHSERVHLFYESAHLNQKLFHAAESHDGLHFEKSMRPLQFHMESMPVCQWDHVKKLNVAHVDDFFVAQILAQESLPGESWLTKSSDMEIWVDLSSKGKKSTSIISDFYWDGFYIGLASGHGIDVQTSMDLKTWTTHEEKIWLAGTNQFVDISAASQTPYGIMVLFNLPQINRKNILTHHEVHLALLDPESLWKVKWRSPEPLWSTPKPLSTDNHETWEPVGGVFFRDVMFGYWNLPGVGIQAVIYPDFGVPYPTFSTHRIHMEKSKNNPLISPQSQNKDNWQSITTFNPAAIYAGGKVHILYRAQGEDLVSRIGYASSQDGIHIDERVENPVFSPSELPIMSVDPALNPYSSGGGYGGCEDPRATIIDNKVYMTYVSYDGQSPPRLAITSITLENFLNKRWFWEKPVLISPPGIVDKSGVLFPEKVNGKYVVLHRIFPNILIDYLDHLNFDGTYWLEEKAQISVRSDYWDSRKIGAGAPPVKTRDGWLLIYYGVDDLHDKTYKIGAMVLDLEDPSKVLYRSNQPIIEPTDWYENVGFKPGVVYPCGAIIHGAELFIYYGGADSVVCVATANLETFLSELKNQESVRLDKAIIKNIKGLR